MKLPVFILAFFLVFASCTSSRSVTGTAVAKKTSARRILKRHLASSFDKKTINAKFKVLYKTKKTKVGFSVQMKLKKDSIIWLKGSKFITLFKAKITPTSVQYYAPYTKEYFDGDFSMLEKLLGTPINFQQLQQLFLGEAIRATKKKKYRVAIEDNAHVLSPKKQAALFELFYFINPVHYKLNKQSVVGTKNQQRLDVVYPSYSVHDGEFFPDKIQIQAQQKQRKTQISFTTRAVSFDTNIRFSFQIPKGYKALML